MYNTYTDSNGWRIPNLIMIRAYADAKNLLSAINRFSFLAPMLSWTSLACPLSTWLLRRVISRCCSTWSARRGAGASCWPAPGTGWPRCMPPPRWAVWTASSGWSRYWTCTISILDPRNSDKVQLLEALLNVNNFAFFMRCI